MISIEELKHSVLNRSFIGSNPLPLSAYILSLVSVIHKIPLVQYFLTDTIGSASILLCLCYLIAKKCSKTVVKYEFSDLIVLSLLFVCKSTNFQSILSTILIFLIIKNICAKNLLVTSIFISLITITDISFISILCVSLFFSIWNTTKQLICPKIKIKDSVTHFIISIVFLNIVPIIVALSFISMDLIIRNSHSQAALEYSIEFQASLKNFDIQKGFEKAHVGSTKTEKTDLYVMDRSIISLLNAKHHTFFSLDGVIKSSAEPMMFCEIHKVHPTEFTDEEPRFIQNGDIVKFRDLNTNMFLGWTVTDSKNKFRNIFLGEIPEKGDFWVVETDGYLRARTNKVKFRSIKSSDYLCARRMKKQGALSVSYNADEYSKFFYITENTNHAHYKENFENELARKTVVDFTKLSFSNRLLEYLCTINPKFNFNSQDKKSTNALDIIFIALIILSSITLFTIYVVSKKYGKSISFSQETALSLLSMSALILLAPIIGFKRREIEVMGLIFVKSLASDLFKEYKVGFIKNKKINWKKIQ